MIAPEGYVLFSEVAEIVRSIARDMCWAYRTKEGDGDGYSVTRQVPQERRLVEGWLLANFLTNEPFFICSPLGVVLRGDPILGKHLDQLEMLPNPIPIEESSIQVPEAASEFELDEMEYFLNRFVFFDFLTGQIKEQARLAELKEDVSGFSKRTQAYLKHRHARVANALRPYCGWSLCVKEADLKREDEEFLLQFGVSKTLVSFLNENSFAPMVVGQCDSIGRPRKRDQALDVYLELFPNGHEPMGKTLKEATNEVSDAMGMVISQDTLRRALGKKN